MMNNGWRGNQKTKGAKNEEPAKKARLSGTVEEEDDDDDDNRPLLCASDEEETFLPLVERKGGNQSIQKTVSQSFHKVHIRRILPLIALCSVMMGLFQVRTTITTTNRSTRLPISYKCPSPTETYLANTADDRYASDIIEEYGEYNEETENNITEFLATYHEKEFDGWDHPFDEFKESLRPFKEKYFVPNIKSGDSIYESASGIGMNLLLTLEILKETADLNDIVVYGNEYVPVSAKRANLVLSTKQQQDQQKQHDDDNALSFRKGIVCPGDSTQLGFVPSNSFDLVFTGYLQPLLDPLDLGFNETVNRIMYKRWCREAKIDIIDENKNDAEVKIAMSEKQKSQVLVNLMQQRQQQFYIDFVAEMIRIAKPGAPIMIESVSYPLCENPTDWGGVEKGFWKKQAEEEEGWSKDVDPDSVEFMDGSKLVVGGERYHVFMRKRRRGKD